MLLLRSNHFYINLFLNFQIRCYANKRNSVDFKYCFIKIKEPDIKTSTKDIARIKIDINKNEKDKERTERASAVKTTVCPL